MVLTAFFGMATKYSEGLLAVKYRVIGKDGHSLGLSLIHIFCCGYKCTNYILWNGVHCAVWINVEYSHGIEAGIKRIPFGVSTGILVCSVF